MADEIRVNANDYAAVIEERTHLRKQVAELQGRCWEIEQERRAYAKALYTRLDESPLICTSIENVIAELLTEARAELAK